MVIDPKIPQKLLEKLIKSGYWSSGFEVNSKGEKEIATSFRLHDGRHVDLLVLEDGTVKLWINPGSLSRGEPLDPDFFNFSSNDIVALVGRRKVKTGWFPWQYKWEDYDLVNIE